MCIHVTDEREREGNASLSAVFFPWNSNTFYLSTFKLLFDLPDKCLACLAGMCNSAHSAACHIKETTMEFFFNTVRLSYVACASSLECQSALVRLSFISLVQFTVEERESGKLWFSKDSLLLLVMAACSTWCERKDISLILAGNSLSSNNHCIWNSCPITNWNICLFLYLIRFYSLLVEYYRLHKNTKSNNSNQNERLTKFFKSFFEGS